MKPDMEYELHVQTQPKAVRRVKAQVVNQYLSPESDELVAIAKRLRTLADRLGVLYLGGHFGTRAVELSAAVLELARSLVPVDDRLRLMK